MTPGAAAAHPNQARTRAHPPQPTRTAKPPPAWFRRNTSYDMTYTWALRRPAGTCPPSRASSLCGNGGSGHALRGDGVLRKAAAAAGAAAAAAAAAGVPPHLELRRDLDHRRRKLPLQPLVDLPAPVGHQRGGRDNQRAAAGGAALQPRGEQHPHGADALERLAQPHAVRLRGAGAHGARGEGWQRVLSGASAVARSAAGVRASAPACARTRAHSAAGHLDAAAEVGVLQPCQALEHELHLRQGARGCTRPSRRAVAHRHARAGSAVPARLPQAPTAPLTPSTWCGRSLPEMNLSTSTRWYGGCPSPGGGRPAGRGSRQRRQATWPSGAHGEPPSPLHWLGACWVLRAGRGTRGRASDEG